MEKFRRTKQGFGEIEVRVRSQSIVWGLCRIFLSAEKDTKKVGFFVHKKPGYVYSVWSSRKNGRLLFSLLICMLCEVTILPLTSYPSFNLRYSKYIIHLKKSKYKSCNNERCKITDKIFEFLIHRLHIHQKNQSLQ